MELVHSHTVTWTFFIWSLLLLVLLWLFTSKTQVGRNIINQETRWSINQWKSVLIVVGMTLFILINPLFHLFAVLIVGALYFIMVSDGKLKRRLFQIKEGVKGPNINLSPNVSIEEDVSLICKPKELVNMLAERNAIEKCLFSFPYMKDRPFPSIQYLDGQYHLRVNISSEKYLASLMEYLGHAGFETKLKNRN